MNRNSLESHLVERAVTYDLMLDFEGPYHIHDFGSVLGRPLGTFFWALRISRSRLLARV